MAATITLLHGTCGCKAKNILELGTYKDTYLTNDEDIAEYFAGEALEECEKECDEAVILQVDAPTATLEADRNAYDEPLTYYRDNHTKSDDEWYEMLESGEIPSPSSDADYQTSLDIVKCAVSRVSLHPDKDNIIVW